MSTLFLRDKSNNSVVDIDLWTKRGNGKDFVELRSAVVLRPFTELLLANLSRKDEVIADFTEIEELRGWFWERWIEMPENSNLAPEEVRKRVRDEVIEKLTRIGKKYGLGVVED